MPNLPYFAVQFDYKGERGFGHVIEGVDDAPDRDLDGEERRGELGDKGGGEFPRCVCSRSPQGCCCRGTFERFKAGRHRWSG